MRNVWKIPYTTPASPTYRRKVTPRHGYWKGGNVGSAAREVDSVTDSVATPGLGPDGKPVRKWGGESVPEGAAPPTPPPTSASPVTVPKQATRVLANHANGSQTVETIDSDKLAMALHNSGTVDNRATLLALLKEQGIEAVGVDTLVPIVKGPAPVQAMPPRNSVPQPTNVHRWGEDSFSSFSVGGPVQVRESEGASPRAWGGLIARVYVSSCAWLVAVTLTTVPLTNNQPLPSPASPQPYSPRTSVYR